MANSMVAEEIALENKEKMSNGGKVGADITNGKTACVQMDTPRDRSTNTREQVAKMSGVGTGTVARYDAIMKTDVLIYLNPTFAVEAKSVVQQRKLENVLKNWKDYMGLEMARLTKRVITELVNRIIRLTKNFNPTLQHKWVSQLTLFKTISFLQT